MAGGLMSLVWNLLFALLGAVGWLAVAVAGASLWMRELRLPGGLVLGSGVLGLVVVLLGTLVEGIVTVLLPESYASLDGALITPDNLHTFQQVAWALLDPVRFLAYALLVAGVFVGRSSTE